MPVIERFDGGVVTGVDSHYLASNQATVLINVDVEKYGMKSAQSPIEIGKAAKSFYEFKVPETEPEVMHVTSSSKFRDYAEFQGRLAYSDGGPVCQITDGDLKDDEFIWRDLGIDAPEGTITAHALTLADITGGKAVLHTGSTEVNGFINAGVIRYKVVDTNAGANIVYTHDITDNTGNANVVWTLPSGFEVYRELVDERGMYSDRFVYVGTGNFTDGMLQIFNVYERLESTLVAEFSSHRLAVVKGNIYSVPYKLTKTSKNVTLHINEIYELNPGDNWIKTKVDMSIHHNNPVSNIVGIASAFALDDELFVIAMLGKRVVIFNSKGTIMVDKAISISTEFFKCTTVEWDNKAYMFDPAGGKALIFANDDLELKTMPKFPYAKAEDSIYTVRGAKIYAILNNRHEGYVREFELPSLKVKLTGSQRVAVDKIKGLGGSSGCDFSDGAFQIFPTVSSLIMFSPSTDQIISTIRPEYSVPVMPKEEKEKLLITPPKTLVKDTISSGPTKPTNSNKPVTVFRGFAKVGNTIRGLTYKSDDPLAILRKWNVVTVGSPAVPKIFDIPTLTGVYLYNVGKQISGGGGDGPIMQVQGEPITVYKGHIKVDVTGVTDHASTTTPLRLYRTGGYLAKYTMVDDVNLPTNGIYMDTRSDQTIALGRLGVYDFAYPPPEGLQFLTEHKGKLWGAVGHTLYYSETGNADRWDKIKSFIIIDRDVTALASTSFGLVIFMKGRCKLLLGDGVNSFVLNTISNEKGTIDSRSVQAVLEGVIFFSEDGMCFTDGRQVVETSYELLGTHKFNIVDSMVTSRTYWALCDNFMFGTLEPARLLLRFDMGKQPQFSFLEADGVAGLGLVNGKLSHSLDNLLYDTLGGEDRIFNYKSGNISEGLPTMVKEWDRVRISGDYFGWIIVRLDDVEVLRELIVVDIYNISNLHLPKHSNKAKSISFEALGSGIITSIEYSLTPRSTTK